MTQKISFKIKTLRTVNSPSQEGVTTYFAYVNFRDLPEDLPLDVNPRKPKMNTAVGKALKAAVESSDTDFDINNRGIVIVAKDLKFDSNQSTITLNLDNDPENYGILDGGHTYTAIIENRENINDSIDKYVKLEVIVGESLTVSRIADARNTSATVSDIALFELDDKFDFIKKAVETETYAQDIAIKDNSPERLPIIELLKLLFIFNNYKFSANEMPTQAYSGKAAVFKDIREDIDNKTDYYKNLATLLPTLVKLYDKIETDYRQKFIEYNPKGRFGGIRGVDKHKDGKKPYKSLFMQTTMEYKVSVGYILPVFGAFRVLINIDKDKGQITWRRDPFKMWDKVGSELVKNTLESSRNNPQDAGKNSAIWSNNYSKVENELFRELLSQQ